MGKCFITKLNGVVDNNSLLAIGEMRINMNKTSNASESSQGFNVLVNASTTLEIMGDGYFTDKTLSENKGKILTLISNVRTPIFLSNDDIVLSIKKKYNIVSLTKYSDNIKKDISINIDDLKYVSALTMLSVSSPQVTGSIDSLKNLTALTTLSLINTQVTGSIDSLKNLTALTTLSVSNTQNPIIGSVNSLARLSNLNRLSLPYSNLSGDLALLPPLCTFISVINSKSNFTWSTRSEDSKILAIEGSPKISNIDKMLNNQANCQTGITGSSNTWDKNISCSGTRTSASDAAVQTLQSKGYTVSITPA